MSEHYNTAEIIKLQKLLTDAGIKFKIKQGFYRERVLVLLGENVVMSITICAGTCARIYGLLETSISKDSKPCDYQGYQSAKDVFGKIKEELAKYD